MKVSLKYSLLNDKFTDTVGKRLTSKLREAISSWTNEKNESNAEQLIDLYIQALSSYWKKTGLEDLNSDGLNKDLNLVVDLVYKKGRKPNSIRLDNNPALKKELLEVYRKDKSR